MRNRLLCFSVLLLAACSSVVPTFSERMGTLERLSAVEGFKKETINTSYFNLVTAHKDLSACKGKIANIYIEGDGLAWRTSHTPSNNPTPINPVALKLALQDKNSCTIYMARPCQYAKSAKCKVEFWTNKRFSSEVIQSYNEALSSVKERYKIAAYKLFGYSGGGAIAAIVASERSDVSLLVTIAGNLDTNYWTNLHHISPLSGSLNPANFSSQLSRVKQLHLIGGKDKIVPFGVYESFFNKFEEKQNIKYKLFKSFDHHCCWVQNWRKILETVN